MMPPEIINAYRGDDPRRVGETHTIKHGNGATETRLIIKVKLIDDGSLAGGYSEVAQVIQRTEPSDDPRSLPCLVCDKPIADRRWEWAAMHENGPVHTECFMTDEQLRAKLDDADCDSLVYCDGINNCQITRDPAGGPHFIYP